MFGAGCNRYEVCYFEKFSILKSSILAFAFEDSPFGTNGRREWKQMVWDTFSIRLPRISLATEVHFGI
jgi:hypothetical protein